MTRRFLDTLAKPVIGAARDAAGIGDHWSEKEADLPRDRFTAQEAAFIRARDSFYMASMSRSGWPYIQHRGGPKGFLRQLDDQTLGFIDFAGNRQYLTVGNVSGEDRVALFLMDYPNRRRLKILAHATIRDLAADPALTAMLATPGYRGRPERAVMLKLHAFDWNCSQHITPRFTEAERLTAETDCRPPPERGQ